MSQYVMGPRPKPIETYWNGLHFRSRLEARWAVFYDRLGIRYVYEPEGYKLGNGVWYLPDFWLPEQECFIEVKPEYPTENEILKAERLCAWTGSPVFIAHGPIGSIDSTDYPNMHEAWFADPRRNGHNIAMRDSDYQWCRCMRCGKYGIQYAGRSERICRHTESDRGENPEEESLAIAYRIARQIRFEEVHEPVWQSFISDGRQYARRITSGGDVPEADVPGRESVEEPTKP